jgi:hypothetical protein
VDKIAFEMLRPISGAQTPKEATMGEKGKRDKGKKEVKKQAKLTIKEKRKLKKEKAANRFT